MHSNKHTALSRVCLFAGVVYFLFAIFLQKPVYALENPQRYYDWNTYNTPKQVLGLQAFAQETSNTSEYKNYQQHNYFFGFAANATPNTPLYFVKKTEEGITLTFTFNSQAKEQVRLELAGERLNELTQMTNSGSTETLAALAKDYQNTITTVANNLEQLKKQGQDVKILTEKIDIEAAKHTLVLEEVALQVPPAAQEGLNTALAASEKAVDTVADISGKPAVPEEVVERLQALKAQGILTEEEVAKLIAVGSREKAREELKKYAQARILPEADLKKLDETALEKFPDGYFTALEIKKFKELKDLETQKPDEATLQKIQEFAKNYKPGDIVPPDIRRWWIPMVRLEELQNTIRPDLLSEDFFKYRPEDKQKYQEVVERIKPRAQDVKYINNLIKENPTILNDPAYARIKAIADKFGSVEKTTAEQTAKTCASGSHWVTIPYMPDGGYCVPNYVYEAPQGSQSKDSPCPPGYHRNVPGGTCYPDNPNGSGIETLPAPGSCPAGYGWITDKASTRGGFCSPSYLSDGGSYPKPISIPGYCPSGQIFRDGKCEPYNPPPSNGCPEGQFWSGQKCLAPKDCGAGKYQDQNGECKEGTTKSDYCERAKAECSNIGNAFWDAAACQCRSTLNPFPTQPNPTGTDGGNAIDACKKSASECGSGSYLDYGSCTCKQASPTSGASPTSCTPPASGCGTNMYWEYSSCSCKQSSGQYVQPTSSPTNGGASQSCGSGYHWNGSYCAANETSQPQPQPQPELQQTQTTPQPQPQPEQQQTQTQQTESQPSTQESSSPSSSGDSGSSGGSSGSSCPSGSFWNGFSCQQGEH